MTPQADELHQLTAIVPTLQILGYSGFRLIEFPNREGRHIDLGKCKLSWSKSTRCFLIASEPRVEHIEACGQLFLDLFEHAPVIWVVGTTLAAGIGGRIALPVSGEGGVLRLRFSIKSTQYTLDFVDLEGGWKTEISKENI